MKPSTGCGCRVCQRAQRVRNAQAHKINTGDVAIKPQWSITQASDVRIPSES